jgi:hypothetical protein
LYSYMSKSPSRSGAKTTKLATNIKIYGSIISRDDYNYYVRECCRELGYYLPSHHDYLIMNQSVAKTNGRPRIIYSQRDNCSHCRKPILQCKLNRVFTHLNFTFDNKYSNWCYRQKTAKHGNPFLKYKHTHGKVALLRGYIKNYFPNKNTPFNYGLTSVCKHCGRHPFDCYIAMWFRHVDWSTPGRHIEMAVECEHDDTKSELSDPDDEHTINITNAIPIDNKPKFIKDKYGLLIPIDNLIDLANIDERLAPQTISGHKCTSINEKSIEEELAKKPMKARFDTSSGLDEAIAKEREYMKDRSKPVPNYNLNNTKNMVRPNNNNNNNNNNDKGKAKQTFDKMTDGWITRIPKSVKNQIVEKSVDHSHSWQEAGSEGEEYVCPTSPRDDGKIAPTLESTDDSYIERVKTRLNKRLQREQKPPRRMKIDGSVSPNTSGSSSDSSSSNSESECETVTATSSEESINMEVEKEPVHQFTIIRNNVDDMREIFAQLMHVLVPVHINRFITIFKVMLTSWQTVIINPNSSLLKKIFFIITGMLNMAAAYSSVFLAPHTRRIHKFFSDISVLSNFAYLAYLAYKVSTSTLTRYTTVKREILPKTHKLYKLNEKGPRPNPHSMGEIKTGKKNVLFAQVTESNYNFFDIPYFSKKFYINLTAFCDAVGAKNFLNVSPEAAQAKAAQTFNNHNGTYQSMQVNSYDPTIMANTSDYTVLYAEYKASFAKNFWGATADFVNKIFEAIGPALSSSAMFSLMLGCRPYETSIKALLIALGTIQLRLGRGGRLLLFLSDLIMRGPLNLIRTI